MCRESAGQHSRGAMGSSLLAWGAEQSALCWINLLVLIWSIQMFLAAVAACHLVFSAGFSVWALPFPCCCPLTGCFPCNPVGPPGWGACRQGCSPMLLCLPGSLGRWAVVFCNLKAKMNLIFP